MRFNSNFLSVLFLSFFSLLFFCNACSNSSNLVKNAPSEQLENYQTNTVNYDSLKTVLETIYDLDQNIRHEFSTIVDSLGMRAPEVHEYFGKMMHLDSLNQMQMEGILSEYGWLPQSKIGEKAASAIFLVIQHSEIETMEKYFEEFKAMAEKGEADRADAAKMEDRLLMWGGKKQIYGTQASNGFRGDGTMAVWPIEDPENVNKRRKEVGFTSTVEVNAKRLKAVYDPNEPLPVKD